MAYLGAKPDAFQYTSTSSQSLSGDGVTTTFTLSRQVSANSDIEVVVNNVPQEPGFAYYVTNLTNLIFTAAPSAAANNIYIVYRQFVQSGIAPGANTVTTSAIAANTIQPWQLTSSLLNPVVNTFTGTGANTVYTLAFTPPSSNSVVVTINGITQNAPVNYSTNGSTLTFTDPPALNSVIRVLQQAVIGTSIVPVDGSVGTSKLASGLTLSGSTTLTGNLAFTSTGQRITGDMSNATITNRFAFQSSTTNGNTSLNSIPNGSAVTATFNFYNSSDITNASLLAIGVLGSTDATIRSNISGTGTYLPLTMYTGGSERMRIDTSGNVGIATTAPAQRLQIGLTGANNYVQFGTTNEGFVLGRENATGEFIFDATQVSPYNVFKWRQSGTERMRIASDGSVGIGTAGPVAKLHVSAGNIRQESAGDDQGFEGFGGSTHIYSLTRETNSVKLSSFDGIQFWTGSTSGVGSGTERMRINSAGEVAIGTTPYYSHRLAVAGSTVTQNLFLNASIGGFQTGLVNDGGTSSTSKALTITNAAGTELQVNYYGGHSKFFSTIGVGNTAGSTSGAGISFPATQVASSNANTLDDYEEGTWTPVLRGDTTPGAYVYDTNRTGGQYVKIGRQVMIRGVVSVSSVSSAGTGTAQITGIPFAQTNPAPSFARAPGNLTCQLGTTALATTGLFVSFHTTGDTSIDLQTQSTTTIAGIPVTTVDDVNSIWSFTYIYLTDN
jgi:hypothetical protein